LAKGFKDDQNRFHPISGSRLAKTRASPTLHDKTLQVGIQGSQIAKTIAKQAKDFAIKNTEKQLQRLVDTKERNERELQVRRDYEKRLISSFKRARKLQIKDPVLLKNQLLIDVPEIKDNDENLRFVERILNDFIKREKTKDKLVKKAKSPEEKDRIETAFDQAELLEEADVKKQLVKADGLLKEKQKERLKELEKETKLTEKKKKDIAKEAIKDFVQKEEVADQKEKQADLEQEQTDKKAEDLAKQKSKDEREIRTTNAFINFIEAQSEAVDARNEESIAKDDAEEAREVAETLVGEIETGFPKEIIA